MEQVILGLVAAAALLVVVVSTRPRAIDLVVIGLPIAGVVGAGARANLSPADAFLPLALLAIVATANGKDVPAPVARATFTRWALYFCVTSLVLLGGLTIRLYADPLGTSFGYGASAVVKLWVGLAYFAVFVYYGSRLFSAGDRLLALWARVATLAALAGALGVGMYAAGIATPLTLSYRATGGFDDPNLYASYLLVSISLTFAAGARSVVKYPVRMVAIQSVALALTGSRAAIPALAIGVVAALVLGRGRLVARTVFRWVALLAVGVGIAAWRFPSLLGLDAFSRVLDSSVSVEGDIRLLLWRTAYDMWMDHPILGVGIGQFIPTSADYVPGGLENIPHNTHLSLLAETGLLGWLLVMGLPLLILMRLSGLARRTDDPTPTWLVLGLVAALTMAWTLNLENFRGLWAYFGLCLAYWVVNRRPAGAGASGADESYRQQRDVASKRV